MTAHDEDHPLGDIVQPVTTSAYWSALGIARERHENALANERWAAAVATAHYGTGQSSAVQAAQAQAIAEEATCTTARALFDAAHAVDRKSLVA